MSPVVEPAGLVTSYRCCRMEEQGPLDGHVAAGLSGCCRTFIASWAMLLRDEAAAWWPAGWALGGAYWYRVSASGWG